MRKRDKFTLLIVRLNATKVLKSTEVGKPFQAFMTRSLKKELSVQLLLFPFADGHFTDRECREILSATFRFIKN